MEDGREERLDLRKILRIVVNLAGWDMLQLREAAAALCASFVVFDDSLNPPSRTRDTMRRATILLPTLSLWKHVLR